MSSTSAMLHRSSRRYQSLEERARRESSSTKKGAERALGKQRLEAEPVEHKVPEALAACPQCRGTADRPVGVKESLEYEYMPDRFRKRVHCRQTLLCACDEYVVTAPAPPHVGDKTAYGAGSVAHVAVSKCANALPLHRLEKRYVRLGAPVARSTLCDLFHQAGRELASLAARVIERIARSDVSGPTRRRTGGRT